MTTFFSALSGSEMKLSLKCSFAASRESSFLKNFPVPEKKIKFRSFRENLSFFSEATEFRIIAKV